MTQEHLNLVRIDLGAIKSNLEAIKEAIGPERQVLAMVKGNAYGHGDLQVAQMIEDTGCAQMLGVACPSEAQGLRAGGIKMPILILTPTIPANLETAIKADVILSVCGQRRPWLQAKSLQSWASVSQFILRSTLEWGELECPQKGR